MYLEKIVAGSKYETECYGRCKLMPPADFPAPHNAHEEYICQPSELELVVHISVISGYPGILDQGGGGGLLGF